MSEDKDLLSRLNALRKSNSVPEPSSDTVNDDLAERFLALKTGSKPSEDKIVSTDEDDKTIEELLADLGSDEQWKIDLDDATETLKGLEKLSQRDYTSEHTDAKDSIETSGEAPAQKQDEPGGRPSDEVKEAEADDALQAILAELKNEPPTEETAHDSPNLDLPSAPTEFPEAKDLTLPSAPTAAPQRKKKAAPKKFTDDEIDSWCIICLDDAAVKCTGCDGDLYCRKCWKEGHMRPDAGYEEKTHKWVKYEKKKNS